VTDGSSCGADQQVPIGLDLQSWGTLLDIIEGAAPRLVPGLGSSTPSKGRVIRAARL
jgi:hypothetical protein